MEVDWKPNFCVVLLYEMIGTALFEYCVTASGGN